MRKTNDSLEFLTFFPHPSCADPLVCALDQNERFGQVLLPSSLMCVVYACSRWYYAELYIVLYWFGLVCSSACRIEIHLGKKGGP